MAKDFPDAYARVLENAEIMVEELEQIDPESVDRETWEEQFIRYMEARDRLEACEKDMYAAIFGESSGKGRIREYLKGMCLARADFGTLS